MIDNSQNSNQIIVLKTLDTITQIGLQEFEKLPINERIYNQRQLIELLKTIPGISSKIYLNENGNQKSYITRADLNDAPMIIAFNNGQLQSVNVLAYFSNSLAERERNTIKVKNHLKISGFSPEKLKTQNGIEVSVITQDLLNEIVTYTATTPAPTPLKSRLASDIYIDWVNTLWRTKNELQLKTISSEPSYQALKQIELIEEILEEHKESWLRHELTTSEVRAFLKNDSEDLRQVGLNSLADFAYANAANAYSLNNQLNATNKIPDIAKQIHGNKYSAVFEFSLVSQILKNPPKELLDTMGKVGRGLNLIIDDFINHGTTDQISPNTLLPKEEYYNRIKQFSWQIKKRIVGNQTYWLSQVPEVGALISENDPIKRIEKLQALLNNTPKNGMELISIPYLAQKVYASFREMAQLKTVDDPVWMQVTEKNNTRIVALRDLNHRANCTLFSKICEHGLEKYVSPDQVSIDSDNSFIEDPLIINNPDDEHPRIGKFIHSTLENGISLGSGVSGTTNLFLAILAHLNQDRALAIDTKKAFLGLTCFLVGDFGHTLHESLWTADQRQNVTSTDGNTNRYLKSGLIIKSSPGKYPNFISDYEAFFSLFDGDIRARLNEGVDTAWHQTVAYFSRRDYFSGFFQLKGLITTMIADLKANPEINIKKYLQNIITTTQKNLNNKSRLTIANQLKDIVSRLDGADIDKTKTASWINNIIYEEQVRHHFMQSLQSREWKSTFQSFNQKNINSLLHLAYQTGDDPGGFVFLSSLNYILKNAKRSESFNSLGLANLINSYLINLKYRNTILNNPQIEMGEYNPSELFNKNENTITKISAHYVDKNLFNLTKDEVLTHIAENIKNIRSAFSDNASKRAVDLLITNALLIKFKLPPTILDKSLENLSIEEIKDAIKSGEDRFHEQTKRTNEIDLDTSVDNYKDDLTALIDDMNEPGEQYLTTKENTTEQNSLTVDSRTRSISASNDITPQPIDQRESSLLSIRTIDSDLDETLSLVSQLHLMDDFNYSSQILYQQHQINQQWIPHIDSVIEASPNTYQITFFDPSDVTGTQKRLIETNDSTFLRVKNSLNNDYNQQLIPKEKSISKSNVSLFKPLAGTGLSLLFAAHAYFSSTTNRQRYYGSPLSKNLIKSLQLHYYLNITQIGVGVIQDTFLLGFFGLSQPLNSLLIHSNLKSYVNIAKHIGLKVQPIENILSKMLDTSYKVSNSLKSASYIKLFASKGVPVIGTLLSLGSFGFDIKEYTEAQTAQEKKIFGTKLAFGGITFGLTLAGTIASFSTAAAISALATPLFIVALPIGIVGGFIVSTMQNYSQIENRIEDQVFNYFIQAEKAYKEGYSLNKEHNALQILPGAVVQQLNLETGLITLGSQYVCIRDQSDKKRVSSDDSQAVSLRSALDGKDTITINSSDLDTNIIYLPGTPMSYVSYNTANIIGFNEYTTPGYEPIRRIENYSKGKFDLEIFSSMLTKPLGPRAAGAMFLNSMNHDNLIYELVHKYQLTTIEILLDTANRTLIIPELPTHTAKVLNKASNNISSKTVEDLDQELNKYHQLEKLPIAIHYNMTGKGGHYTVGLNEGASIRILTAPSSKPSTWTFITSNLTHDDINIQDNKLIIGESLIFIDPTVNTDSQLFINQNNGDISKIDIPSKSKKIVQLDAQKWNETKPSSGKTFDEHLNYYIQNNQLTGEFIPINNYTHAKSKTQNPSRAYYDVKNKRILFTKDGPVDAVLGLISRNSAYFFDKKINLIWETDIATGEVKKQYHFSRFIGSKNGPLRLWQEGGRLLTSFNLGTKKQLGEIIFQLNEDSIELVAIKIHALSSIAIRADYIVEAIDILKSPAIKNPTPFNTKTIGSISGASSFLTFDYSTTEFSFRCWLRMVDKVLIQPNLKNPSSDLMKDLMLIGSIKQIDQEVFYFIDVSQQALYMQKGAGTSPLQPSTTTTTRISGNFINAGIINTNNGVSKLFAITPDGLKKHIDSQGNSSVITVTEEWLTKQGNAWIDHLSTLEGYSFVVLGLKNIDGSPLLAWHHAGRLIVSIDLAKQEMIQLMDSYENDALFFDAINKKIYKQTIFTKEELLKAFGNDLVLDKNINASKELFPGETIISTTKEGQYWNLMSNSGLIFNIDIYGNENLIELSEAWLKANTDLEKAAKILNKWPHKGAFKLHSPDNQTPSWYVPHIGLVILNNQEITDHIEFIGKSIDNNCLYFSNLSTEKLHAYQYNSKNNLVWEQVTFNKVNRFGSTLLIQKTAHSDTLQPILIQGVDHVILMGQIGPDKYVITKEHKSYLKTIIIDNYATDESDNTIELAVNDHNGLNILSQENDLVITDLYSDATIIIRGATGKHITHLKLITNDGTTTQTRSVESLFSPSITSALKLEVLDYSQLSYPSDETVSIWANLQKNYVDIIHTNKNQESTLTRKKLTDSVKDVTGTQHNDFLFGDNKANKLKSIGGNNLFQGNKGNDVLEGGTSNDTFLFSADDGHDTIHDAGGTKDTLKFILGQMQLEQFIIERNKQDLIIRYNSQKDSVTVINHFQNTNNAIEKIAFDNGALYDISQLTQTAIDLSTGHETKWSYLLNPLAPEW